MILCVAPSPAWDVTYHLDRLRLHATNRAGTVAARAGGKAVNVARLLSSLGEEVAVVAPLGGGTGELFARDLVLAGIPLDAVASDTETRRTTTIVCEEAGDATVISETSQVWRGRPTSWAARCPGPEGRRRGGERVVAGGRAGRRLRRAVRDLRGSRRAGARRHERPRAARGARGPTPALVGSLTKPWSYAGRGAAHRLSRGGT